MTDHILTSLGVTNHKRTGINQTLTVFSLRTVKNEEEIYSVLGEQVKEGSRLWAGK